MKSELSPPSGKTLALPCDAWIALPFAAADGGFLLPIAEAGLTEAGLTEVGLAEVGLTEVGLTVAGLLI